MRDAKQITGPKKYFEDLMKADALLRETYPKARREGSVGAYTWTIEDNFVVAEAWIHRTKSGWWVRIKEKK
jgi:hypothetical protein